MFQIGILAYIGHYAPVLFIDNGFAHLVRHNKLPNDVLLRDQQPHIILIERQGYAAVI